MAIKKQLAMMLMGSMKGKMPMMSSKKEEQAEKQGVKGYPKQSAKEEAKEMMPMKGKKGRM